MECILNRLHMCLDFCLSFRKFEGLFEDIYEKKFLTRFDDNQTLSLGGGTN